MPLRYGPSVVGVPYAGGRVVLRPPELASSPPDLRALAARAVAALPASTRRPILVVPDRTRRAAVDRIVPALVAELRARRGDPGLVPRCLFASGTHAPMSDDEVRAVLGGIL